MLCFSVNPKKLETAFNLSGAYVVGSEGVPLPADIVVRDGQLVCQKRADGPAGVSLLWSIDQCGTVMLETGRLMDREKPYHLVQELTRGRLTRIQQKREDWGLFDWEGVDHLNAELDKARNLFIESLKSSEPEKRDQLAEEALKGAYVVGEKLTHFHADLLLTRRKQTHGFTRRTFGGAIDLANATEPYRKAFRESFDYAHVAMPWRLLEPEVGENNYKPFDAWVEWLAQNRIPIKMGPLVSCNPGCLPSWLGKEVNSYEKLRSLIFDYVRRIVSRYGPYVTQWDVISGIHAENPLSMTFEQLMELTRTTVSLVKQLAPQSQVAVDIILPWGEYYARDQRTIPPLLYTDMVVQSGIGFDAIGAQFMFGAPLDGMYLRDMFQISEKLDRLGNFGKPVHLTAVGVPSQASAEGQAPGGGCWWSEWSEETQARWVKEFYSIALSKPFIESITWKDLIDRPGTKPMATAGLLKPDFKPKAAYKVMRELRQEINKLTRRPPNRQG